MEQVLFFGNGELVVSDTELIYQDDLIYNVKTKEISQATDEFNGDLDENWKLVISFNVLDNY